MTINPFIINQPPEISPQQLAANQNAAKLQQAQDIADNNIAVAKELEARGIKDAGLLSRANEISHMSRTAQPNSARAKRVVDEKRRLLQDSGMNTSSINSKPLFVQASEGRYEGRAKIRQRRSRVRG